MRAIRMPIARLKPDTGANENKILWGILQSHRVVGEFIKCGFMSHPTIVAEMGAFTITERVDCPSQRGQQIKRKVDFDA